MEFIKEFKDFATKGNVIELAVGVIIGGAFGKIINSLIEDVITPLLLKPALDAAHLTKLEELKIFGSVQYGSFIAAVINFIIIAFVLFMVIKSINVAQKKEKESSTIPYTPSNEEKLLTEIRDLLKK